MRPFEIFSIPGNIGWARRYEERVFDWLIAHYDVITSRLPAQYAAYMPSFANGCSLERLARAREFFAMPEHHAPGTDEMMAKTADQVTDCAGLRDREGRAVNQYLRRFSATD